MNILGSKIFIFGGQVEGYFFNDLVAFDLNALQQASNRWEVLIQNTIDGGPPHGQIPPARTNHTMITWNDKLYLFGGTDGVRWFNDVWSYSSHTNSWTQLECIGYIPSPREGHAAALVGDVMYIFGGRNEEGNDLGDLAAFRISSRRWYTFQNMGPSPSPRSGHSMTTVGKHIVVLAGEPSSAPRDPVELGLAYFLDTGKIRYPPDSASQTPVSERIQGTRRPSGDKAGLPLGAGRGQPPRELMERERMGSGDSGPRARTESNSRLPRAAASSGQLYTPNGPTPQNAPPRTNGVAMSRQPTRTPERALSPTNESVRAQVFEVSGMSSPQARASPAPREVKLSQSPTFAVEEPQFYDTESHQEPAPRQQPETYQPSQDQSAETLQRSPSRSQQNRTDMDRLEDTPRQSVDVPELMPKVQQLQQDDGEGPQDSGIGSSPAMTQQYDELAKELEQVKQKNAWYASELALARKSGYQHRSADSPVLDERATEVIAEDDKPLIEALLRMRAELARVQETIDGQSRSAAERIAEMARQRDTAINEAVFAKARLAGHAGQLSDGADGKRSIPDQERHSDMNKRLASSLAAQSELSRRVDGLIHELEAEKKGRALAEDTAEAAQKRVTELDVFRQQHSSEIETLRSELHEAQSAHREISANHSEITAEHQILVVDKNELNGKLERALAETENHDEILSSVRTAVQASTDKADMLERKLDEERQERDGLQHKLTQLRAEHEERSAELEGTSRRLRDAEDMADKHAQEAKTHRDAVLAGLGKVTDRGLGADPSSNARVRVLLQQIESANAMVRQNQSAADLASEKLRRAEERIAGLEAYQEQASREGLSIRKQLQGAMKENQTMSTDKAEMEQKLQSQMLETNALAVQHSSLKDILAERGINAAEVRRSRALDSPNSLSRFSAPDLHRLRELEQQLEASLKSHDDMKTQFEEVSERDEKMKREYEEKLTALDNDHQAAVKYLRGTEKMLSKMKQELQRVKNENGEMKKKVEKAKEDEGSKGGDEWEAEKEKLKQEVEGVQAELKHAVGDLETRIATMQAQLSSSERELQETKTQHATSRADLTTLQATHTQSRGDIERLHKENTVLEERARDAENKVQLLLDQVESSVDNYRRQSRMMSPNMTPTLSNGTFHQRGSSGESNFTANHIGGSGGGGYARGAHSRNASAGGESNFSIDAPTSAGGGGGGGGDARNSLALDSLATELDALRSHWETTNKNYRLSDKFDFERAAPGSGGAAATSSSAADASSGGRHPSFGGLANWRRGLEVGSEDEDASRPTTAADTVRGEDEEGSVDGGGARDGSGSGSADGEVGTATATPGGMI